MNVCMIVYNNATKDGRVMREAHSLRAAGHAVTVIGIPDPDAKAPVEYLDDGVRVLRVLWQARAYRKLLWTGLFRALPFLALVTFAVYELYRLAKWLLAAGGPLSHSSNAVTAAVIAVWPSNWLDGVFKVLIVLSALAILYLVWRMARVYLAVLMKAWEMRAAEDDTIRRYAASFFREGALQGEFPSIKSRIPDWVPDWLLEVVLEPLDWFGAKTGRFSLYRYRAEEMAALAIKLRPDVIHCHDCAALPTGWLIKQKLNIPLVYDAHEIYEAAATRTFGVTDYYIRVHRKYLSRVDAFITINESAALYYRCAYPAAPAAVVIRNAMNVAPVGAYDGRLHRAAGVPSGEKILLYQGGFTQDRGLPTLVRAGPLLPDGWSLVMMGWGPLAGELKQIASLSASRLGKGEGEGKVHFVRSVPPGELLSWTQGAAAGIIPYENNMLNHWISTPNKLWEYPNAGVPLIVQPFPEMRRVVETYHCGWVLPDELSPGAIADLVASLTDDMLARAKEGCRRFIERDSWSATYEGRLLEVYERLAVKAGAASLVGGLSPAGATT
jgi:glycosyltransferase involved in cell wall biosynthesis